MTTKTELTSSFAYGLHKISALCFSINYPTIINVPHSLLNAYKKVLSFGLKLNNYSWNNLHFIENELKYKDKEHGRIGDVVKMAERFSLQFSFKLKFCKTC